MCPSDQTRWTPFQKNKLETLEWIIRKTPNPQRDMMVAESFCGVTFFPIELEFLSRWMNSTGSINPLVLTQNIQHHCDNLPYLVSSRTESRLRSHINDVKVACSDCGRFENPRTRIRFSTTYGSVTHQIILRGEKIGNGPFSLL